MLRFSDFGSSFFAQVQELSGAERRGGHDQKWQDVEWKGLRRSRSEEQALLEGARKSFEAAWLLLVCSVYQHVVKQTKRLAEQIDASCEK